MRLLLAAVGHKMPAWVAAGYDEYARRLPREARLELIEIKPEKRGAGRNDERGRAAERDRILAAVPAQAALVALDERGELLSTLQWADSLRGWMDSGRDVVLAIGGADGLHADVRARAERVWSLSRLTLPHGLVRVVVAEQLYRAVSVLKNHPYHREG